MPKKEDWFAKFQKDQAEARKNSTAVVPLNMRCRRPVEEPKVEKKKKKKIFGDD